MNTRILLAGAVLAAAILPAGAQDRARQVTEIQVLGANAVEKSEVLQRLETKVGQVFDPAVAAKDQARLMESGLFKTAQVTKVQKPDGVQVVVRVEEQVRVGNISFLRNKAFTRSDLVKELPFGTTAALTETSVAAGRQAIINKYRSAGYDFVKVDVKPVGTNQIVYDIVEGPQVTVTAVRFSGNLYFSGFTIRRKIETAARLWPFIEGRLNTEQVARDENIIRNLYVDEGFLDATVGSRTDFTVDKTQVVVTFLIHEGRRYSVRSVRFENNKVFSDSTLLSGMKLHPSAYYTAENAKADIKNISDKYGKAGYAEVQVLPRRLFAKEAGGFVDLVFQVKEGNTFRVGQLRIKGANVTQEAKIRNVMQPLPGQLLDKTAIDRAEKRLQEMGLFEEVKVSIYGKAAETRDVLVEVKEGATAQFMVGAGVSSKDGLVGTVSYRQRNFDILGWPSFKGAGQTLAVVAEPGTEMMRFRIEWYDPSINNSDYSLGSKIAYFQRERESYTEERLTLPQVSVGRRFANNWAVEGSFSVNEVWVTKLDHDAPDEVVADEGTHTLLGPKVAVVKDRTDSRYLPSEGDRTRFSWEELFGTETFGHGEVSYAVYHTVYTTPLGYKHIVSFHSSFDAIVGDAPVTDRLYAGGLGSVRGFRNRTISPRSESANGNDDVIGGKYMALAGLEYNAPLVNDDLRWVAFVDSGTVTGSDTGSNGAAFRASVGVGIEWRVKQLGPMPMQFYFAVPVAKDSHDDAEYFSFSVGWIW